MSFQNTFLRQIELMRRLGETIPRFAFEASCRVVSFINLGAGASDSFLTFIVICINV